MGKFASMLCDMEWYMNKYSATTEEHVHNITIIVDVSVLGNTVGHGEKKSMECLHPQVFDLKLKERGEVKCTLFLSLPFPPLYFTSEEAFFLTVRLSASEARKESALILELMLG